MKKSSLNTGERKPIWDAQQANPTEAAVGLVEEPIAPTPPPDPPEYIDL